MPPLCFFERHLSESLRPDARPLGKARDTIVNLGLVSSADESSLAKIGSTMEVMISRRRIHSRRVPHASYMFLQLFVLEDKAETAAVISKRLSDTILRCLHLYFFIYASSFTYYCVLENVICKLFPYIEVLESLILKNCA